MTTLQQVADFYINERGSLALGGCWKATITGQEAKLLRHLASADSIEFTTESYAVRRASVVCQEYKRDTFVLLRREA